MPSSYTSSLRLTLPATGELSGTWGDTVNNGITTLLDNSVAGTVTISHPDTANYTLTTGNGTTDEARYMFLNITGTLTAARNVVCPNASKLYFVRNNTTGGFAVTVKTAAGTGISVPNGAYVALYCDATNVVYAFNSLGTLSSLSLSGTLTLQGGTGNQAIATGTISGSTGTVRGFTSSIGADATASTSALAHFTALSAAFTAGAAVTNQYGFLVGSALTGGTTNLGFSCSNIGGASATTGKTMYAFHSTVATATGGGTAYNLYLSGTAPNYLNGDLGVGTTAPSTALHVKRASGSRLDVVTIENDVDPALVFTDTGAWSSRVLVEGSTGSLIFENPSSTERMRIASDGTVNVGSSVATAAGGARNLDTYNLENTNGASAAQNRLITYNAAGASTAAGGLIKYKSGALLMYNEETSASGLIAFNVGASERMRIDSSGSVGIGTSPSVFSGYTTLSINNATNGGIVNLLVNGTETARLQAYTGIFNVAAKGASTALTFETNGAERARIDASGNLGLGVTPSAWLGAGYIDFPGNGYVGNSTSFSSNTLSTGLNAYYGSGSWRYKASSLAASRFDHNNGTFAWYTAPSGTAGNAITFTQAMTLDSAGNLGLGVTPSAWSSTWRAFDVLGAALASAGNGDTRLYCNAFFDGSAQKYKANGSAGLYIQSANSHTWYSAPSGTAGGTASFTLTFSLDGNGAVTSSSVADAVGYKGVPQNSQTASYTLALSDMGKHISITTGGVVIPANASVAFPIGSTISVFNNSASTQTISITTDTLRLAGGTSTGTRTLAVYGVATLMKVASTVWVATGNVT